MTGRDSRQTNLRLDFLTPGVEYTARIFADGKGADWQSNPYPVEISETDVNSTSIISLNLARSGGAAIIITPKEL